MRPSLNAKELALEAVKGNIKHNGSRVFATRGLLFFDKKKKKADRRHQRGGKSTSELEQISLESF